MNTELKGFANSLKELTAQFEKIVSSIEKSEIAPTHKSQYLTFKQTCEYLGLTDNALYNMTSRKQIPHYKPNGKTLYFAESDLIAWIECKRIKTATEIESEAAALITR